MALPTGLPNERRPFLELRILLDRPEPHLRRRIEEVLEGKSVRLSKITVSYTGHGQALADRESRRDLSELTVEEVFRQRYAREHEGEPPEAMLAAFAELVDAAHQREG